jgi:DNA-binding NtrC family response regulator
MRQNAEVKILVVDDDDDLRRVIVSALKDEGFSVAEARNGEEALAKEAVEKPGLVLMDLNMPVLDGLGALKALKEKNSAAAVVMMSGNQDIEIVVQCIKLGADDYISKPFAPDDLLLRVQNTLRTLNLQGEVERLRGEIENSKGLARLIGESPAVKDVVALVRKVAGLDITVLLQGESGTGKEVVAESIHLLSHRRDKPLVCVDCTAIPETLVESELFGYEKGAFTGATERRQGRFESANGGTLFLDEIGNLPMPVQMKLLRVIQERQITRLGSKTSQPIDVRIIAATNADLRKAIEKGEFREDLYHRLNEFLIPLPPLREREGDVRLLANYFCGASTASSIVRFPVSATRPWRLWRTTLGKAIYGS